MGTENQFEEEIVSTTEKLENAKVEASRPVVSTDWDEKRRLVRKAARLEFWILRQAFKTAGGLVAIKRQAGLHWPNRVSIKVTGDRVDCELSSEVAARSEAMMCFWAGQIAIERLFLGGGYVLEFGTDMQFVNDVAVALQERIGEILVLAGALFAKGELRGEEIKRLVGKRRRPTVRGGKKSAGRTNVQ
jgi:hypothetical protein